MADDVDYSVRWESWGLYKNGGRWLVEFTSCLDVDVRIDGKVCNEPIEQGSFAAYNKAKQPMEISATMAIQGTPSDLENVLQTLSALQSGTTLFSFVTPEWEFQNLTLETFDYSRKRESGVNLLVVSLSMLEVREITAQYGTTKLKAAQCKNAENADTTQRGNVSIAKDLHWDEGVKSVVNFFTGAK